MSGLILFPLSLIYIFICMILYKIIKYYIKIRPKLKMFIIIIFVLIPTYDIVISNVLGIYYQLKVNKEIFNNIPNINNIKNFYIEDNIDIPSIKDRKNIILNYINENNIEYIYLNSDDKYIYGYDLKNIKSIIKEKNNFDKKNLENIIKEKNSFDKKFLENEEKIDKNIFIYKDINIIINKMKINSFFDKFIYLKETKIINNKNETIGKEITVYRKDYNIFPNFTSNTEYHNWAWEIIPQNLKNLDKIIFEKFSNRLNFI